jgi:hypothetical protein
MKPYLLLNCSSNSHSHKENRKSVLPVKEQIQHNYTVSFLNAIPHVNHKTGGSVKLRLFMTTFLGYPVKDFLTAAESQNLETELISLFRTVHNCQGNISFMSTINGKTVTLTTVVLKMKLLYLVILDSRSTLFWNITQRRVVIPQQRFGQPIGPIFKVLLDP